MPLEQEIRHEPLAAHSHKRKEHIGEVSLSQGQERSDNHHNHTGDNAEKKPCFGHSAYDAVLLAHRARLCNALSARKVKTEIDELIYPDSIDTFYAAFWTGTVLWTFGIEPMGALPLIFHG